ncbi:ParB/RepB/Spo0J family partition protein [Tepidibacillus fermentans]|uniref:ParB family chromosome partitioning protein n=1 Tax=Tepidibacillus fermentans TaxID=1281767 RepID=A0A4R3KCU8_9BACI|nr:ParB/RepB/Spo0J family partition protein [Tepidibacillus fermentans]TCS80813.1 ParB family chromosome partitioning protein [Tepidibacillus fermentans]
MNKRLGRGLDALIPSLNIEDHEKVTEIEINQIRPNPYQPRKVFNQEQLSDLMASIKEHGVIQPIIVRKTLKGYEIVAGERRWRASKELQFATIPAVVKEFTDQQIMEIALIENLQREDLNAIEIANAYEKLMKTFQLTQEELSVRVGKSRPHVANILRLLQLPKLIQEEIMNGRLSMGHARALIALDTEEKQINFAKRTIEENWSVRTLEEKIQQEKRNVSRGTLKKKTETHSIKAYRHIEEQLRETFKTSVKIKQGKNKGKIEIEYFDQNDLQRILELMGV